MEKVVCSFCKEPVISGEFWVIMRGYSLNVEKDGTIDSDELSYGRNFNIKYEEIICKKCLMEGRWKKYDSGSVDRFIKKGRLVINRVINTLEMR